MLVLYDAAVDADDWSAVLQAVKAAERDVTVASTLPELVSDGAIAGPAQRHPRDASRSATRARSARGPARAA